MEVSNHRFLRYESKLLAIFLNVEVRDGLVVYVDGTRQWIVESLNELYTKQRGFVRKRLLHQMDELTLCFYHIHWLQQEQHTCLVPQTSRDHEAHVRQGALDSGNEHLEDGYGP